MFKISQLNGVSDADLEIGYKRIGRLLALSLEYQALSSANAVKVINNLYRTGVGCGKITEGQFGRFVRGQVLHPNYATVCDIASMIYKPSHFRVTPGDLIGQPVIKANRHGDRDNLIYMLARKAEELPNYESRCSGADLLQIILDPPLMQDFNGGKIRRTPLFA